MDFNYETATEEELVAYCSRSNPYRTVISELRGGHSVIRIPGPNDAVVKCGCQVTREEAEGQHRAYHLIDQTIIRVPRVYRYVQVKEVGYMVMEFIDGEPLQDFEDPTVCYIITRALSHFAQIQSERPGPLGGGLARGLMWLLGDEIAPTSIAEIEEYYHLRQLRLHNKLNLKDFPLILCHMDIAPRNVLKLMDGSLCLLDWEAAGFYPRCFEICTLHINNPGNARVSNFTEDVDENEFIQARLLEHAYWLGEKHHYIATLDPSVPVPSRRRAVTKPCSHCYG